jgi:hypothetical protein
MKKVREWQIIYAICCLVYMGWMIHVGGNEFNRINGQYRLIVERLDEEWLRTAAFEELKAECRKGSSIQADRGDDDCLFMPPPKVEARIKVIEERLLRERGRGLLKLVLFYAIFIILFLLTPPALIYLLIIGIIKLYLNIKIVR